MHNTNSFQIKIDEILNINGIKGNRIKHQTNSLFQFNLNFFMQGIRLKKMTFLERDPIEPHASMENSCHVGSEVGKSHERSSSFTLSTWSQSVSNPSRSCCSALFSGTKHKRIQQGQLLYTLVPCRQPDLSIKYYPWSESYIRRLSLHPNQRI